MSLLGDYYGGDLVLDQLGLQLHYRAHSVTLIRSARTWYRVLNFLGERMLYLRSISLAACENTLTACLCRVPPLGGSLSERFPADWDRLMYGYKPKYRKVRRRELATTVDELSPEECWCWC